MKAKQKYICEICGTEFENPSEAIDCEDSHITIKDGGIVQEKFNSNEKYPHTLIMTMADGTERAYWNYCKDI